MPHMMPMLWVFIFMSSFLFLFILSSMTYFFYLPNTIKKNPSPNKYVKLHKWNWMW